MRVLHVCYSDGNGGAYIGAYHLHKAMLSCDVDSTLLVFDKVHNEPEIKSPFSDAQIKRNRFQQRLEKFICRQLSPTGNDSLRSFNLIPSGLGKEINKMDIDIVQLHWINSNTLSIGEIGKIKQPLVWKMADMWAFSGMEHYKLPADPDRHINGYSKSNRPEHESGIDLNQLLWLYKKNQWKNKKITFVGPSRWLAEQAKKSRLFSHQRVEHILNPVNLEIFKPISREAAITHFGLENDKKYVMFCSWYATEDKRKGYQYLDEALGLLSGKQFTGKFEVIILGTQSNSTEILHGFKIHNLGLINNENEMALAYNLAELIVLPTILDNLPNVIKEGTACGIPCVGFEVGGIPDMISHKTTGYLAEPYRASDIANGIEWLLNNLTPGMKKLVRETACKHHDPQIVVNKYLNLYREVIYDHNKSSRN